MNYLSNFRQTATFKGIRNSHTILELSVTNVLMPSKYS